jgi:hypothetical protein
VISEATADEALKTAINLRKSINDKVKMIDFIFSANIRPTASEVTKQLDSLNNSSDKNKQELADALADIAQKSGIQLTRQGNGGNGTSNNANDQYSNLTSSDKNLIDECRQQTINKKGFDRAIRDEGITQTGFENALMAVANRNDTSAYNDTINLFLGKVKQSGLNFPKEFGNAMLLLAAKTGDTNLLLRFDRKKGGFLPMYDEKTINQAIMIIVKNDNNNNGQYYKLLRSFTFDLDRTPLVKPTEAGINAALIVAKQRGASIDIKETLQKYLNNF